jgi:protein tyrosine phosphatase (PTP) superfamily phosphohydrolase (DUF442 family)
LKPKRIVWISAALLVALLGIASDRYRLWELWYHVMPRNFATVEPGQIYRGAFQFPFPMRRIIRNYGIKTILAVRQKSSPGEPELAQELGLNYHVVPITRASQATDDQLDAAAAILADAKNYPVYLHCHGGRDRTNMAVAAYRIRYCGWTLEQTVAELGPWGLDSPRHLAVLERYLDHVRRGGKTAHADAGVLRSRSPLKKGTVPLGGGRNIGENRRSRAARGADLSARLEKPKARL